MIQNVAQTAYAKAIFHACKYPFYDVNGVLIGYDDESVLNVVDTIPLFHGHLSLLPLLEASLMQIDSLLAIKNKGSSKQLQIVGYYFANENLEDKTISALNSSIATKIAKNFPNATLWMVCIFFDHYVKFPDR
jgi:hypothetical protein